VWVESLDGTRFTYKETSSGFTIEIEGGGTFSLAYADGVCHVKVKRVTGETADFTVYLDLPTTGMSQDTVHMLLMVSANEVRRRFLCAIASKFLSPPCTPQGL